MDGTMARTRILPAPHTLAAEALASLPVLACALALICAGRPLPFF